MSGELVVTFNAFPAIIEALREGSKIGVRIAANEVCDEASATSPYDEGVMSASHYVVASDLSTYSQATAAATSIDDRDMLPEVEPPSSDTEAIVAVAAYYAIFVHDGTRHMSGRPWLAQSAVGAADRVAQITADQIGAAIEKVAPPYIP